jgi:D-arabinose 1-dehydrogenase-like Zn-dependent alcohol dehydrogenase
VSSGASERVCRFAAPDAELYGWVRPVHESGACGRKRGSTTRQHLVRRRRGPRMPFYDGVAWCRGSGSVEAGEWVAVFGCGGVGLASVDICTALGANVIAVSRTAEKLALAKELGAVHTVNASEGRPAEQVLELTGGGAHVSIDALGDADTTIPAVLALRVRGRHLRLGTSSQKQGGTISLPVDMFVFRELQFVGSFGMQAARYPDMLRMVESGKLHPGKMVRGGVPIEQASDVLESMTSYSTVGMEVITQW